MGKTTLLSNVKAQSQKIFKGAKELLLENNLVSKSVDDSVSKVLGKSKTNYDNLINFLQPTGEPSAETARLTKDHVMKKVSKPKDVSILGSKISESNANKIHEAVANGVAYRGSGIKNDDINGTYNEILKKTKGSINSSMPGAMLSNYYAEPFKKGQAAAKNGVKFADNKPLQQAYARAGLTATAIGGATAIGVSAASKKKDERERREYS